MRRDQAPAFGLPTDAITKIADKLDGRRRAKNEELTWMVNKGADLSTLEELKEEAEKARETYEPPNPVVVYNTLINRFPRTCQAAITYRKKPTRQYEGDAVSSLQHFLDRRFSIGLRNTSSYGQRQW